MKRSEGGFSLIELLVVLTILGLLAGISGLVLTSLRPPAQSDWVRVARAARSEALRTGRPVRAAHRNGSVTLFLPDGRALGPGADPLTGSPLDAIR